MQKQGIDDTTEAAKQESAIQDHLCQLSIDFDQEPAEQLKDCDEHSAQDYLIFSSGKLSEHV